MPFSATFFLCGWEHSELPPKPWLWSCPLGKLFLSYKLICPLWVHTFSSFLSFLPVFQHLTSFLFPFQVPLDSRSPHLLPTYKHILFFFLTVMQLRLWVSRPPMSRLSFCPPRNTVFQRALYPLWSSTQADISNLLHFNSLDILWSLLHPSLIQIIFLSPKPDVDKCA